MAVRGLIIPRSYNEYINVTDPVAMSQALQLNGVMDDTPTENSVKPAKSGGIKSALDGVESDISDINTALAGKQDTLTFDDTPTSGSSNPVKSGGVYTELANKQNGKIDSFSDLFPTYTSFSNATDLIAAITTQSEVWAQVSNSLAATLNTQGVLPVSGGGVLHAVKTASDGRCIAEYFADDKKHYHYETSNVSSNVGSWQVDVNGDPDGAAPSVTVADSSYTLSEVSSSREGKVCQFHARISIPANTILTDGNFTTIGTISPVPADIVELPVAYLAHGNYMRLRINKAGLIQINSRTTNSSAYNMDIGCCYLCA